MKLKVQPCILNLYKLKIVYINLCRKDFLFVFLKLYYYTILRVCVRVFLSVFVLYPLLFSSKGDRTLALSSKYITDQADFAD